MCIRIHKAVEETFIDNPNNYPTVNHKYDNKLNNNINNLEWCKQKNITYYLKNHLTDFTPIMKSIINVGTNECFNSTLDAAKNFNKINIQ